jgi:hypothetical protein
MAEENRGQREQVRQGRGTRPSENLVLCYTNRESRSSRKECSLSTMGRDGRIAMSASWSCMQSSVLTLSAGTFSHHCCSPIIELSWLRTVILRIAHKMLTVERIRKVQQFRVRLCHECQNMTDDPDENSAIIVSCLAWQLGTRVMALFSGWDWTKSRRNTCGVASLFLSDRHLK